MASLRNLAAAHRRRQVLLARRAAAEAARLWRGVDRTRVAQSWTELLPHMFTVATSAQGIAAASAGAYVDAALEAQGADPAADGSVSVPAFTGVASDGRGLAGLLFQPAITTLTALKAGAETPRAMAAGLVNLDMIVRTQVADAGRAASAVAITARRSATGFVRMLTLPSCDRCIILAGQLYEWSDGFKRHPRCDCVHIPVSEDQPDELLTQPRLVFDAMPAAQRDKVFTKAGAEAIRLGADINQVVNARRGATGLTPAGARLTAAEARALRGGRGRGQLTRTSVLGQNVFVTTEGTTTRGVAGRRLGANETGSKGAGDRYRRAPTPRLMPESILEAAAGDRDEAIRLLARFGYITRRPTAPRSPTVPVPAPRTFEDRARDAAIDTDALRAAPAGLHRTTTGLDTSQVAALAEYQDGYQPGFRGINAALRGAKPSPEADRWVQGIDASMSVSPLARDVLVWRGVRNASVMFGGRLDADMTGLSWTEQAYVSTSAAVAGSEDFSRGKESVQMRIVVPAGTRAVDLSDPSDPGEAELLLDRGHLLYVVADRGYVDGVRLLDVEVRPKGATGV